MLSPTRLVPLLFVLVAACGSTSSPVDVDARPGTPDAAAGQPDAQAGQPDAAAACSQDGEACSLAGSDALCSGGACAACIDDVDDALCEAAYGAGNVCLHGACVVPQCTTSAQCAGQTCVDGMCVGCQDDGDCNTGEVCDTTTGVCGPAASECAGLGSGDACGPGNANLCCNRMGTLTCVDVECCGTDASTCPNPGTDTCEAGVCVPATSLCDAPPDGEYWVDPSYVGVRTGSQACPYLTLHGAFNAVRNDSFTGATTVYVKGTINAAGEGAGVFPLGLPVTAYVRSWPGLPDAVIVAPMNTSAFEAKYTAVNSTTAWSARLSQLELKQATGGGAGGAGVLITGGSLALPIRLDHIEIHGFYNGVNVETGGAADLNWGVNAHDNTNDGLRVAGGRADMVVGVNADARSHFDHNADGIHVSDDAASILTIAGVLTTGGFESVTASDNTSNGLSIASPNVANTVTHLGVIANAGSGVALYGGAKVKLRHLNIDSNLVDGIHLLDNGSSTSIAGIDLGTLADKGFNRIANSTDSHVCVSTTVDGSHLRAEGNQFGNLDCSVANPTQPVRMFLTCAGHGGGFNDGAPNFRESVANCVFEVQP